MHANLFANFLVVLLAIFMVAVAVFLVVQGVLAILHQSHDLAWRAGGGVSLPGINLPNQKAAGVLQFRGVDAIRFGIGLIAAGAMFAIWCIGGVARFLRTAHDKPANQGAALANPSTLALALAWPSFVCLLVAVICFFPPWRLEAAPLYGIALLSMLFALGLEASKRRRYARLFFPAIILAVVVVAQFRQDVAFAMAMGLFAFIGVLVHLALLLPKVGRMLDVADG